MNVGQVGYSIEIRSNKAADLLKNDISDAAPRVTRTTYATLKPSVQHLRESAMSLPSAPCGYHTRHSRHRSLKHTFPSVSTSILPLPLPC